MTAQRLKATLANSRRFCVLVSPPFRQMNNSLDCLLLTEETLAISSIDNFGPVNPASSRSQRGAGYGDEAATRTGPDLECCARESILGDARRCSWLGIKAESGIRHLPSAVPAAWRQVN